MTQTNLYINSNVDNDFLNLEKDILAIEEILNNTMLEMEKLDENVWNTKEKEEINKTFIPFLRQYKERYPNYLRKRIDVVKTSGIQSHEQIENEISDSMS